MMVSGDQSPISHSNATKADSSGTVTPRERFQGWQAAAVVILVVGLGFVLLRAQWAGGFGFVAVVCLVGGWIGVWTAAALGAGRPVARWVDAGDELFQDDPLIAVIAGAGVLVGCAAVLSVFGWYRPIPLMTVLVGWAAFGFFGLKRSSGRLPRLGVTSVPLLGLAGVSLLVAATVSPFYDQWHQHLGFPWIWLADGSVHPMPRNWYSYMPVNASLLYGYGLRVLGPWSAQAIHWWCGVVTVLAVARLAGRAEKRSAAMWGVIVLATTPTFLRLTTVAGSDLVVSVFAAGAWLGLVQTAGDGKRAARWWAFSGVCVGLAVGAKYTAIGTVAIPLAAAAVALHRPWRADRSWNELVSGASLALVSSLAAFLPWAVRNLVAVGNPLFPFANGPFKTILKVPFETAERYSAWLSGFDFSFRHIVDGLDFGTFAGQMDGFPTIGLLYLGLVLLVPVCWRRIDPDLRAPLLVGVIAGFAFWIINLHVHRYVVPVLVPAAVLIGTALAVTIEGSSRKTRAGLIALLTVAISWNFSTTVSREGLDRLGSTLGVVDEEETLHRWVSSYVALDAVRSLPDHSRVHFVAEARALGFERPVDIEHPFGAPLILELARRSRDPGEIATALSAGGVTHVLTNRWEARRIAEMQGRERFFEYDDPTTAANLAGFSQNCLEEIWSERGVSLYRLEPVCSEDLTGAGDLATW
jgi:hypothetical protein